MEETIRDEKTFGEERLNATIREWVCEFMAENKIDYAKWSYLYEKITEFIEETAKYRPITDEDAIDRLQRSGWMAKHDMEMTAGNFAAVINNIMADGKKSVSISIYPVEEGTGDD